MLYRVIKRMIGTGNKEGLVEKVDIFFAAGKLTTAEYEELISLLGGTK